MSFAYPNDAFSDGVQPPLPSDSALSGAGDGQLLLTLVRQQNAATATDSKSYEETVLLLRKMIALIQRKGLLQNQTSLAEQVLAHTAFNTTNGKKKRYKRGRGSVPQTPNGPQPSPSGPTVDVQLLLTAVTRILDAAGTKVEKSETLSSILDDSLVVALTANLLTSAVEHIKTRSKPDVVCLAEYELVVISGRGWLTSLAAAVLVNGKSDSNDDGTTTALIAYRTIACLRAAAAVMSLLTTKLSRNVPLLDTLVTTAYATLTQQEQVLQTDPRTIFAATAVLAAVPLAGHGGAKSCAQVYDEALRDTVLAMKLALQDCAPIYARRGTSQKEDLSSSTAHKHSSFLDRVQAASAPERGTMFVHRLEWLTSLASALLTRHCVGGVGGATVGPILQQLRATQIPLDQWMTLVQILLGFSTAAESKYYSTKKRLRGEDVQDGLLSPADLVGVANRVRVCGHTILDQLVQTLGAATLLPITRRIAGLTLAALQSSSSTAVRKVLDPALAVSLDGKRPRWLHTSLVLRTAAVRSMRIALTCLGTDPRALSASTTTTSQLTDTDRALAVVCGHVMEQLSHNPLTQIDDDWGSIDNRVQLLTECAKCLTACLSCGGDYLNTQTRELIDSITATCLSSVSQNHSVTISSASRHAILELGVACVSTPWQDGALTSLPRSDLMRVAQACQQHADATVVSAATLALVVCHALDCPRVPALQVVTRSSLDGYTGTVKTGVWSSSAMVDKLESARTDMQRTKEAAAQAAVDDNPKPGKMAKVAAPKLIAVAKQHIPEPAAPAQQPLSAEANLSKEMGTEAFAHVKKDATQIEEKKSSKQERTIDLNSSVKSIAQQTLHETLSSTADGQIVEDTDFPMIVDCGPDEEDA